MRLRYTDRKKWSLPNLFIYIFGGLQGSEFWVCYKLEEANDEIHTDLQSGSKAAFCIQKEIYDMFKVFKRLILINLIHFRDMIKKQNYTLYEDHNIWIAYDRKFSDCIFHVV